MIRGTLPSSRTNLGISIIRRNKEEEEASKVKHTLPLTDSNSIDLRRGMTLKRMMAA